MYEGTEFKVPPDLQCGPPLARLHAAVAEAGAGAVQEVQVNIPGQRVPGQWTNQKLVLTTS